MTSAFHQPVFGKLFGRLLWPHKSIHITSHASLHMALAATSSEPSPRWFVSRWWVLTAAIIVQNSAGLTYCFSVYSKDLERLFDLSERRVTLLGFYCSLGGYLGVVSGLCYDAIASTYPRVGPRCIFLVGAVLNFVGYYGLYLAATGVWDVGFAGLAVLLFTATNAGTWIDTAALVTCVNNFPNSRGYVVGLLKSFVGLSGAIYTVQYEAFLEPDSALFFRFAAISVSAFVGVAALLTNRVSPRASDKRNKRLRELGLVDGADIARRFTISFACVVLLSAFLCTASLLDGLDTHLKKHAKRIIAACAPLVLIPAVVTFATAEQLFVQCPADAAREEDEEESAPEPSTAQEWDPATPLLEAPSGDYDVMVRAAVLSDGTDAGAPPAEVPLRRAVLRMDFWLLFTACFLGMGAGLVYINSLGQYAPSLGASRSTKDVLVALISVGNALGRLLGGAISQISLTRLLVPRTVWLTACAIGATLLNLFLATNSSVDLLYPISIVQGLLFGAHWSLMPSITSELYGLRNFASNYCALQLAAALGSFALAQRMTAALSLDKGGEGECVGVRCYSRVFLANSALCLVGVVVTAILIANTRYAYRRIAEEALRKQL